MDSRRKAAVLFLLAFGCGSALPQVTLLDNNRNFGDLQEGEQLKRFFIISNSTSGPVRIDDVRPKCGCTVLQFKTNTLLPGQKTRIDYSFRSTGYSGAVSKSISVTAAGIPQQYTFSVNVLSGIYFQDSGTTHAVLNFGKLTNALKQDKILVIRVTHPEPDTRISNIDCNTQILKCAYPYPAPVGGEIPIIIRLKSDAIMEPLTVNIIHKGTVKSLHASLSGTVVR